MTLMWKSFIEKMFMQIATPCQWYENAHFSPTSQFIFMNFVLACLRYFFPCASHLHRTALLLSLCSLCSSVMPRTTKKTNTARVFLFSTYVLTCSLNIHGLYLFPCTQTHTQVLVTNQRTLRPLTNSRS